MSVCNLVQVDLNLRGLFGLEKMVDALVLLSDILVTFVFDLQLFNMLCMRW